MALTAEDLKKLGANAQRQILRKLGAQAKESKYHSAKAKRGNITYDSQREARRFDYLMLLFTAGKIRDLKLQPQFTLQESYMTTAGNRVRAIRYVADFSYRTEDGETVVEDAKGVRTREYALKKKMMQERFGIDVQEV